MKKTKQVRATGVCARKLFTVMVAFLLVLGFNACSNGGGGGGPAGGPGVPSTGTGDNGGKYTNPKTGEDYKVGDTGPGGGKIFYDSFESEEGKYITMTDNNEKVRYLEVAGANISEETLPWMTLFFVSPQVGTISTDTGTETAIGTGRKNTALMKEDAVNRESIVNEIDLSLPIYGGKTDWFLPSKDELFELAKFSFATDDPIISLLPPGPTRPIFWSSSQATDIDIMYAYFVVFSDEAILLGEIINPQYWSKTMTGLDTYGYATGRLIRAF